MQVKGARGEDGNQNLYIRPDEAEENLYVIIFVLGIKVLHYAQIVRSHKQMMHKLSDEESHSYI